MAAMFNQITKLFNVHQQQMLCYCCSMVLLISVEVVLRNLWSHTGISHIWMYSFKHLCKLSHGSHIEPNQKLFAVHQQQMLCYCSSMVLLISIEAVLRNLWSHTCISPHINAQFCTFMQIASWRPYWTESENCSTCINYRCCVIVCTTLH